MKIGRPKEFDENIVLNSAMEYFWDNGYDNSTLPGLLKAMDIKKSSFYQTFKSKQQLFERCMQKYIELNELDIQDKLKTKSSKSILRDIMNKSIDDIRKHGEIRGCLIMNAGAECYKKYPDLSELIQKHFDFFHKTFKTLIKKAQEEGDISKNKSADMLSSNYINTLNGLYVSIRAGASEEMIKHIQNNFEELLMV